MSVHDLSGARQEIGGAEEEEEEPEPQEDPFADPDPLPAPARRGRGPGRRGRPPGRGSHTASRAGARNSAQLFDGSKFDGYMGLYALIFTDISTNQRTKDTNKIMLQLLQYQHPKASWWQTMRD